MKKRDKDWKYSPMVDKVMEDGKERTARAIQWDIWELKTWNGRKFTMIPTPQQIAEYMRRSKNYISRIELSKTTFWVRISND